jgi:hypothetical protein
MTEFEIPYWLVIGLAAGLVAGVGYYLIRLRKR